MISNNAKQYCREPVENIKGYAEAVADKTQMWDCHHWNEQWWTKSQLLQQNMYYNRPASELVFVTHKEHLKLKHAGRENAWKNDERNKKISESKKGKPRSEETCKKISEGNKGKHYQSGMFGKHHREETCKKISEGNKGKHYQDEESRRKNRDAQNIPEHRARSKALGQAQSKAWRDAGKPCSWIEWLKQHRKV